MKKITFFATALFTLTTAAIAADFPKAILIRDADPIQFTERGVEFFVFPDGQFDFNTAPSYGDTYYKTVNRGAVNRNYGVPRANGGVRVEHDAFGRVRRVGNVFINYDAFDRIKRIGSVYMTYNRFALAQVGGLRIKYNNRGMILGYEGSVNRFRQLQYGNTFDENNDIGTSTNDDDFYYYKSDGTKAVLPKKE